MSIIDIYVAHNAIHLLTPQSRLAAQATQFKCGGFSLSLDWAHVLGDAHSVIDFINNWARIFSGHQIYVPRPSRPDESPIKSSTKVNRDPVSVRRVAPVGDHWIYSPRSKMVTFTFHLTPSQLTHLRSKFLGRIEPDKVPLFEALCAILWQCMAKIKEEEPKVVTICRNDPSKRVNGAISNSQKISAVKADFCIKGSDPSEVLGLLAGRATEENAPIEEAVERDNGVSDFIVYGANLTFVDIQEANIYGLELNGQKPVFADYAIEGAGDEGVVLVLPGPESPTFSSSNLDRGRIVTIILPGNLLPELRGELKKNDMLLDESIFG